MHFKLLFILCLFEFNSFAQSNHFKIIGELPEDINIEIRLIINNDTMVTRTLNKRFVFEGTLDNAVHVQLSSNTGLCGSKFFIEPGIITLKTRITKNDNGICIFKGDVVGSASEDVYKSFAVKRDEILKSTETNDFKNIKLKALIESTINANPDFIFSAQLLQQYGKEYETDWINALYQTLSERIKGTKNGQNVKSVIQQTYAVKQGNVFPALALPDMNSQPFSIQSLKGKVVLVDFWASWCLPCRKEIPALKKIYKKYIPQGFEIVAVSLDKDYNKWKHAVAAEKLNWMNLSDLKAFDGEIAKYFGLQAIPFNILIGRDGKIVASHLKVDELEQAIQKIIKL